MISRSPFRRSKMNKARSSAPQKSPATSQKSSERGATGSSAEGDGPSRQEFVRAGDQRSELKRPVGAQHPELVGLARDRLIALARAHSLTLSQGLKESPQAARPTTLHSLIKSIAAPHNDREDEDYRRFSIVGCDMEISGPVISSLALLLHEFATNSTKYGALSATAGRIQIHCANHGETLVVTWTERGGPAVISPTGDNGFGDFLVRTTIAGLGGEIARDWEPNGLVIRLSMPRARLTV